MPLDETSSDPRVPAVKGEQTGGGGEAVYGVNNGSSPAVAVHGYSNNGRGVVGESGSAEGVLGISSTGHGVHGTGVTGVSGESTLPTGIGTSGVNNIGPNAVGVMGSSTSGIGVWGQTTNGLAGKFDGNVQVTGTLSKPLGHFLIDHPLDPANKYLRHSFVESPDMLNIYSGIALLDASGEATVELPGWFEALNEDFRYGLTPIGGPGPNLYIAEEVDGNRLKIAGGSPGMKVSWQITGIRRDPYAVQHRVRVEEDKPVQERGKYLHPKEYGLPESMGIYYDPSFQTDEWRNEHNYVQRK